MAINIESRVVRSSEPMSAKAGDGLIMFSVDKGRYYGLDDVATAIWQRLESPTPVAALCADLQQTFDVAPERCRADVLGFLQKLEAKGLVNVVE